MVPDDIFVLRASIMGDEEPAESDVGERAREKEANASQDVGGCLRTSLLFAALLHCSPLIGRCRCTARRCPATLNAHHTGFLSTRRPRNH